MAYMTQHNEQNPHKSVAGWMITGAWVLVFGLLILFFQSYLDKEHNPNQDVSSITTSTGAREVVLQRNRYGHYVVTGKINGRSVEFMLDTGATQIAIPSSVASRLGLKRMHETTIHTANGQARAYSTRLDTVSVGDIQLTNLSALITTGMGGDVILLGMSFLKHIEFTQRGDILILRQ